MEIVFIENDTMVGDEVITLKEITDILKVRHNDAMKKVEALSKEPSFGELRKTRISYAKGKSVGTYVLNKIQAIAVGAKLNDKLLMKLVNRLEESDNSLVIRMNEQIENMRCLFLTQEMVGETITDHDRRITNIEKNSRLEAWQEKNLQDAKNRKVYELANGDDKLASKLHRNVWREFKKVFHIPRYNEIRVGRYEDGLIWLNNVQLHEVV